MHRPLSVLCGVILSHVIACGGSGGSPTTDGPTRAENAELPDTSGLDSGTTIMARVLGDGWREAFDSDEVLASLVRRKVRKTFATQRWRDYEWVYREGSHFESFRGALSQQGMSPELMAVIPYLAAVGGNANPARDWNLHPKSADGGEECGRGPLNMTWRQAYNLGMREVQYDATVPEHDLTDDEEVLREMMVDSAGTLSGIDAESVEITGTIARGTPVEGVSCVYLEGADKRSVLDDVGSPAALAEFVASALGEDGVLPSKGSKGYVLNRIVKFFAADMTRGFKRIDLSSTTDVDSIMEPAKNADGAAFVMENTAEVVARAVTIPCLAVLDKRADSKRSTQLLGDLPSKKDCILLTGMSVFDQLD